MSTDMTIDENRNWVYILQADDKAIAAALRRLRTLGLALIFGAWAIIGLEVAARFLYGPTSSPFAIALLVLSMIVVFPSGVAYLILPRFVRPAEIEIMVGGDFLFGPTATGPQFLEYRKVRRVSLEISEGVIIGATIAARLSTIHARRVKEPAVLVRAIFERASDKIRWHPSWHPFRRLSREEVRGLIEKFQAPPLRELLPPSVPLARLEDMFPSAKGLRGRLLGTSTSGTIRFATSGSFTPTDRYVNLMLVQMFKDGSSTRVLKRSEPLPAILTSEGETVAPPPLTDVLNRLRAICQSNDRVGHGCVEGTIDMVFEPTRCNYKALCRFDDDSDACCQIRLERLEK